VIPVMDLFKRQFVSSMMIRCAIPLQPICSRMAMTSARFRNSSGTAMLAPRFTPMY
jgi:hypothetical protein